MELIPEWAPNIHPMLVHFPIAILAIAVFFDFISFFISREKKWWNEEATAFLYGIGAVSAIMVYYTGTLAADSVNASAAAESVMQEHAGWAWWTVWFYGIYALARIAATWYTPDRHRMKYHLAFFLLSFVGMFFLYETGEHGAEMVFGYGTGTGQLVENKVRDEKKEQEKGFIKEENGTVIWTITEEALHTLEDNFTFLQGSTALATLGPEANARLLQFRNPNSFFVTNDKSYSSIQMVLNVHPEEYKGKIILAHHVQDADNYAFLSLNQYGTAAFGQVENGKTNIIEKGKGSFEWDTMESIKLSVSGEHLKGYINGKQILHGHSEQFGPGSVGVKLAGKGAFGISGVHITPVGEEDHENSEKNSHEEKGGHSH